MWLPVQVFLWWRPPCGQSIGVKVKAVGGFETQWPYIHLDKLISTIVDDDSRWTKAASKEQRLTLLSGRVCSCLVLPATSHLRRLRPLEQLFASGSMWSAVDQRLVVDCSYQTVFQDPTFCRKLSINKTLHIIRLCRGPVRNFNNTHGCIGTRSVCPFVWHDFQTTYTNR